MIKSKLETALPYIMERKRRRDIWLRQIRCFWTRPRGHVWPPWGSDGYGFCAWCGKEYREPPIPWGF